MKKILLVEDNETLGYILKEYLTINNFEVVWAKDGEEGSQLFLQEEPDLCILDVMMPRKDGFTLATQIKESNTNVPFIFLTAKSLKIDKLKGFKLGADDYIVKPVDEEELVARIHAVLNRSAQVVSKSTPVTFHIGNYRFDYATQTLYFENTKQKISKKEAEILKLLCLQKNQVLLREDALKKVWGLSDYFNRRSMDVFISKLRKYLCKDTSIKITNVHGKGFILSDQD